MERRTVRSAGAGVDVPPAAVRATAPGWRDPRLWVGVLIVAGSVVAGARLMASADDTVAVWSVAADAGPGARLTADDLQPRRVRFADESQLGDYFTVAEDLPTPLRLVRGVGAGELLPRSAVGSVAEADTVELPIAVEADQVPPAVGPGAEVDVHLVAPGAGARSRDGGRVISAATVVEAPAVDAGFGAPAGRRQLVLAVPAQVASEFFEALGRVDNPLLTVVRRG